MLVQIKLKNNTTLELDSINLPLNEDLLPFLDLLNENDIPLNEQFKFAYVYKDFYGDCKKILETIKNNNKDCEETVKLFITALNLQHKKEITIEDDTRGVSNVLFGFYYLKLKEYKKSLLCFKKENFDFGIQICNYLNGGDNKNGLLKAFNNINMLNMKDIENSKEALRDYYTNPNTHSSVCGGSNHIKINNNVLCDVLFGVGLVDNFYSKYNVDVKRRLIEDLIDKREFERAIEGFNDLPTVYKLYFKGKIEHLKENYEKACEFYKQCIKDCEKTTRIYFLCKYALERIVQQEPVAFKCDSEPFNDLNVYIRFKNGGSVGDLGGCSRDMINFLKISNGASEDLEFCISQYDSLIDNKYVESFVVLNNLIYFRMKKTMQFYKGEPVYREEMCEKNMKMIQEAVELSPPSLKDLVLYNQAYLSLDKSLFKKINIKQAQIMAVYLNKDIEELNNMDLVELVACLSDRDKAVQLLSNKSTLYSNLRLGKLYLDKFIENKNEIDLNFAITYFKKESRSYYAANGLGVCLALQKQYSSAIKVFSSVIVDHKQAYINLGNVYILTKDYEKGVRELIKSSNTPNKGIILHLKDKLTTDFLISLYNGGFKELIGVIFEKLIKENRFEEAKDFKIDDKKLLKLFEEGLKESERESENIKRKIKELEEYKRQKNIK